MPLVFVSYNSEIELPISSAVHCMKQLSEAEIYFHPENRESGLFTDKLEQKIAEATHCVFFVSPKSAGSPYQGDELNYFLARHGCDNLCVFVTGEELEFPTNLTDDNIRTVREIERYRIDLQPSASDWPHETAKMSLKALRILTSPIPTIFHLPTKLNARYEKDIISDYLNSDGTAPPDKVADGFPQTWPTAAREVPLIHPEWMIPNPLPENRFGRRADNAKIRVDARIDQNPKIAKNGECLTFPEAGPRHEILFKSRLKVAIVVSGGIAPGINAVISAIVSHHEQYAKFTREATENLRHVVELWGIV